jgi:hypothetical protein
MRVEIPLAEFPDPPHAPSAECLDDVGELFPALGE